MHPLVSVIIPVYNAESFVEATIESIFNQTYRNIEIIIVDDGSTDNSWQILNNIENDKLVLLRQENSGASSARNKGLGFATGKYIQFLDSDDLLSEDKIEEQVKLLEDHPGYLSFCETKHFQNGYNHLTCNFSDFGPANYFSTKIEPLSLLWYLLGGYSSLGGCMIQPNSWLVPHTIVKIAGEWNTSLTTDDDGEFFCRVILASNGVIFANKGINYYRKYTGTSSNLSARKDSKALKSILLSMDLKAKWLLEFSNEPNSYRAIAHQYTNLYYNTYPYPIEINRKARRRMLELGGPTYQYLSGNRLLQILSPLIHWKIFKLIQFVRYELLLNSKIIRSKSKIIL